MGLIATAALVALAGAPHLTVRDGRASIAADRAVGDVLALGADVEIAGVVRGYVYAVSSTVVLRDGAVLLSPVTLSGGALIVEHGARISGSVTLAGAALRGALPDDVSVERLRPPSRAARRAMLRWLGAERPTPAALDVITDWTPGAEFERDGALDDPRELVLGGVARLTFTSSRVLHVVQRRFRDAAERRVQLTAVELADADSAAAFWGAIGRIPERSVTSSVRTSLGDGAHWWFVRRDRGCLLWQRDRWFFALETSAPDAADDPLALTERAHAALAAHFAHGDRP